MRVIIAALASLLVAGCQMRQAPAASTLTKEEATKVAEAAEANFTVGDVKAVMAQYADGAVMFDSAHPAYSTDRKVQTDWAQDFVSMKPADYRVPDRQIQILGNDAFVSSGTETFTVVAGNQRPTLSARFTDVFQRQADGSWKIVNEHVSLPPTPPPAPPK